MTAHVTELGQPAVDVKAADPDDLICWSVTTIIDVLDRPALMYWATEMSAIAAIQEQNTWRGMLADCPPECRHDSFRSCRPVKWLRDARHRRPRNVLSATSHGKVVHALAEEYALTGVKPDATRMAEQIRIEGGPAVDVDREMGDTVAMLDQFDGWLQRFTPVYQAAEVVVYSPTWGYAGTADAFFTVDGFRAIGDYKSTREPYDSKGNPKTPYPEVSLQLAAYRNAESAAVWRARRLSSPRRYYLLSAAERAMAVPVPEVDGGLCIHITPISCEAYPVRTDEVAHRSFLYVLEAARWQYEDSKVAIGANPLNPTR